MTMTHYMELLATAQPWNLIIFMAIPVILAETIAVTELIVLWTRDLASRARAVNRAAGIAAGTYFAGVFAYLMATAVLPLTFSGSWRGPADVIAVLAYLAGVVPLGGIVLLELRIIGRHASDEEKLKLHAIFVAMFLIVAHIAMIAGMLDPQVLGWSAAAHEGSAHMMEM